MYVGNEKTLKYAYFFFTRPGKTGINNQEIFYTLSNVGRVSYRHPYIQESWQSELCCPLLLLLTGLSCAVLSTLKVSKSHSGRAPSASPENDSSYEDPFLRALVPLEL